MNFTSITTGAVIGVGVVAAGRCGKENQVGSETAEKREIAAAKKTVKFDEETTKKSSPPTIKYKLGLPFAVVKERIASRKEIEEREEVKKLKKLFFQIELRWDTWEKNKIIPDITKAEFIKELQDEFHEKGYCAALYKFNKTFE